MYMELNRYTYCIHLSLHKFDGCQLLIISCLQVKESRVSYSESGISDEAELEEAVIDGFYPPRISWEVLYRAVSVGYSNPEFLNVGLEIDGTDEEGMIFLCKIPTVNMSCEASNG